MGKILQTKQDLDRQLKDQFTLLEALADSYDAGNIIVAKSIATTIRVLVHDTANSHSLLGQLGMKTKKFYDTALFLDDDSISADVVRVGSFCGLAGIGVGIKENFVPFLDDAPTKIFGYVDFNDYWNRVIFIDQQSNSFTRKEIILAVANQDGGAHVDPRIEEKYKKLAHDNALGWMASADGKTWGVLPGSELAAIRQIAHEFLRTLVSAYPNKKMVKSGSGFIIGGAGMWLGKVKGAAKKMILERNKTLKVGRNEKCTCGSGKKYKKCCGK